MEQDKITIKMNYCINPLMAQHVHIGGEFSIREGQTAEQAWALALERIDLFYREHFGKESYEQFLSNPSPTRDIVEPKVDAIQGALDEIEKCTTMDELKGLWLMSKGNLTLSTAYKTKEKQLTNAK